MKEEQKDIYNLIGEDTSKMLKSPQLEGFQNRKLDVLLLTDPIDRFWVNRVGSYKDHSFKAITEESLNLDTEESDDTHIKSLVEFLEKQLQGKVKNVRVSTRLTESPVCFVSTGQEFNHHLSEAFQSHQNPSTRILEINPNHMLIQSLSNVVEQEDKEKILEEMAGLLYDQALILEGQPVADSQLFTQRLTSLMNDQLKVS